MRFKAALLPTKTFERFIGSLALLGNVAWVRFNDNEVRFTIIPEQGTQVWAVLAIVRLNTMTATLTPLTSAQDSIFDPDTYTIQSAAEQNTINLEVPLAPLLRALKSTSVAQAANIRLTKKDNEPSLCVTVVTVLNATSRTANIPGFADSEHHAPPHPAFDDDDDGDRETVISQNVPIRVLSPDRVAGLHEPRCREPDVHVMLPPLAQLKAVSDRFTKLAAAAASFSQGGRSAVLGSGIGGEQSELIQGGGKGAAGPAPRLELSATMHGRLRLTLRTSAVNLSTTWTGLANPELDPANVEGGEQGVAAHPSSKMKEAGPDAWATVRVDGRDWSRVLGVGRVGGGAGGAGGGIGDADGAMRVVACFVDGLALVLYVYLGMEGGMGSSGESVLTYYVSSYSA